MNDLCVASVFCNSPKSKFWFDTQLKFLKATTKDFDYIIVNNNCSPNLFKGATHILSGGGNHQSGLQKIKKFFNSKHYKYGLILDSDAFPISTQWFEHLKGHEIASVVRFENLDSFPHPCVLWFKKSSIDRIKFEYQHVKNLVNYECEELVVAIKDGFFPLLRTNVWNPHPILCAIYYDCFYHHGAGSRPNRFRAITRAKYYKRYQKPPILFESLARDGKQFISNLRFGQKLKPIKIL